MRLVPFLCALWLLLLNGPVSAGQKSITYYLDGARVEHEVAALKGYLEYPLPDGVAQGSLRVKPVGKGSVLRVELVPAEQDRRRAREVAKLEERKSELQDQLQDLEKREEIFAAAVKSQSGKAPRKSRTNPDALESLEQGTRFALAQLDSVNRSRRKCQLSINAVERKLAAARKGSALARVWISGKKAVLSYQVDGERWTPRYDLRCPGDGTGELLLHAKLPKPEKGVRCLVSQGTVAQGEPPQPVQGEYPLLSRYSLALKVTRDPAQQPPASFSFTPVAAALPPGEAAAFWRGEYLGSGRFGGAGASEFSLATR